MSFKPEVIADSSGKWPDNALRFATRQEAEANVQNLMMRRLAVRETRVVESDDPVNYRYVNGRLESLAPEESTSMTNNPLITHPARRTWRGFCVLGRAVLILR